MPYTIAIKAVQQYPIENASQVNKRIKKNGPSILGKYNMHTKFPQC
jgi:Asp-tRNA(Asn)/Glu-tRNA(Gln) amidotransferase A subunit family amidase